MYHGFNYSNLGQYFGNPSRGGYGSFSGIGGSGFSDRDVAFLNSRGRGMPVSAMAGNMMAGPFSGFGGGGGNMMAGPFSGFGGGGGRPNYTKLNASRANAGLFNYNSGYS